MDSRFEQLSSNSSVKVQDGAKKYAVLSDAQLENIPLPYVKAVHVEPKSEGIVVSDVQPKNIPFPSVNLVHVEPKSEGIVVSALQF